MTFQVGSRKKYLQAYNLLSESEQAAWLSNSYSLLSEFIFLTTGLLSNAIPRAKCTY